MKTSPGLRPGLLEGRPSPVSADYVERKKDYQLHMLLTEKRHPRTWNLSSTIQKNITEGLRQILAVEQDIRAAFEKMADDPETLARLRRAAEAVARAVLTGQKIFVYGCGATGRLAKQMESALWRPFWKGVQHTPHWRKIKLRVPESIPEHLIGEMTGGDRALVSSLEGLEDLALVGRLQLEEAGIRKGDVVFAITEGGETSSVIGAILAGWAPYAEAGEEGILEAQDHLFFLYNNPDEVLLPFPRSRSVIDNPGITKINLTTGPQALAGSTRMQATTSETYAMGCILEAGIHRVLSGVLSPDEMADLGFPGEYRIGRSLKAFASIQALARETAEPLSRLTDLEAKVYRKGGRVTYMAKKALITVFIDCAERSPTFHLDPLDTVSESRPKSWAQVWTEAKNGRQAWRCLLGRAFRGLETSRCIPRIEAEVQDPFLKQAACRSLKQAGKDQENLYDFSFGPENLRRRGPQTDDLGVVVCMDDEIQDLQNPDSAFSRFIALFRERGARVALLTARERSSARKTGGKKPFPSPHEPDLLLSFETAWPQDPLSLRTQIFLKILLNAHSTGVMTLLGRVVGNCMTHVTPSNLKLIGRATHLIQSFVNDTLQQPDWGKKYGPTDPLTYAEANACLFEAMAFLNTEKAPVSEVALGIIGILEALKQKRPIRWEKALRIAVSKGLENYLLSHNPALRSSSEQR